jgi:hypothetical protein
MLVGVFRSGGWRGESSGLYHHAEAKICSCGAWTPARAAPAERGRPLERSSAVRSMVARQSGSCGAWTPARAAPAGRGRPEEPFWRILAALKGRVFRGKFYLRFTSLWMEKVHYPWSIWRRKCTKFDLYSIPVVVYYTSFMQEQNRSPQEQIIPGSPSS